MTPDDIKNELNELGIDTGKWSKTKETTTEIKMVQHQKQQLRVMRKLLKDMVVQNRDLSAQLQERLNRLKYGGGS